MSCNFHHIDSARSSRQVFVFRVKTCWIQSYLFLIELWAYCASSDVRCVFLNDDDSFSKLIRNIKLLSFLLVIFCLKSFVTDREWDSFALSLRDANVSIATEKNCVFFLLFYRLFHCFQCLHVQKFNAALNERRDREFCSSSFKRAAISSDRALMTWHELLSTKLDCRNKFYKFYRAHSSFFRNNRSILQRSWLTFRVHRNMWSLYQRLSDAFFYFN